MESKTNEEQDHKEEKPIVSDEPVQSDDEKHASEGGWKPLDQWIEDGGSEDEWKPAKVFNEIGTLKKKLSETEKDLKKTNKIVNMMKDHHLRVKETAVQEAIKQLKTERAKALEKDEFGKAEVLRDRIDEIKEAAKNNTALPAEIEQEIKIQSQEPPKVFMEFAERNPWYKLGSQDTMTKKADALGRAYSIEDPSLSHEDILIRVEKDIRKFFPEKFDTPKGSGPNEPGSNQGISDKPKKSYNLTPAERQMAANFGMTEAAYAKELESYKGR